MTSDKGKFLDPQLSERFSSKLDQGKECKVYYVSQYGTPRRTLKKKPPAPLHRVTSVTTLPCRGSRTPGPRDCLAASRSVSLQDLSPGLHNTLAKRRAVVCWKGDAKVAALRTMSEPEREVPSERLVLMALRVYSRLVRNAWARRRHEANLSQEHLKSANAQIDHMKIQVASLKTILKSDEQVIAASFREISTLKSILSKLQEQYEKCKEEREGYRESVERVKEELEEVRTEAYNDKNSLVLARSEAAALGAQLEKEREKIAKLKTDNRALLEKVDKYSVNLKQKTEKINRLSDNVDQLEKQMSSCTQLLRNSQIKIDQDQRVLDEVSGCLRGMKKDLEESEAREAKLRAQLEEAHLKMREQNHKTNKTFREQIMTLVRLETELAMSESPPLKSRIFMMVTSALKIPVLVINAISKAY